MERKRHAAATIDQGWRYVAAYVDSVHFVERLDRLAAHGASHMHRESTPDHE